MLVESKEAFLKKLDETPIDDLDLSVRSYRCLLHAGIKTVGELFNMAPKEIYEIKDLPEKCYEEIVYKLNSWGLSVKGQNNPAEVTEKGNTMKSKKIKVVYAEPADYFPEELRRKYKLGEFAEPKEDEAKPSPADYDRWGKVGIRFTSEPTKSVKTWIISANSQIYDYASYFSSNTIVHWRQSAKYGVGDIVYIYCTRPQQRIMYKCEVIRHSIPYSEIAGNDDISLWKDMDEYEKSKTRTYVRFKLLDRVDTDKLSLDALIKNGLKSVPRGPMTIHSELHTYIDSCFNDFCAEGLFPDVSEEHEYHEGHVRSVKVNAYERSSGAREKCIAYHGVACKICGLDFGERYGQLGEGFIHVHHLKPLHKIGEDYVVDHKKDLIPVCPNCHAMIHRIPDCENMSVEELKKVLQADER
jgi:5-methylcytosine-specific restriction protein A